MSFYANIGKILLNKKVNFKIHISNYTGIWIIQQVSGQPYYIFSKQMIQIAAYIIYFLVKIQTKINCFT